MPTSLPRFVLGAALIIPIVTGSLRAADSAAPPAKPSPVKKSPAPPRPPLAIDQQRVAQIAAMLPPQSQGVGRPLSDRAAWEALAATGNYKKLLAEAESLRKTPIPELPDDLYLEFSKTGNRTNYQNAAGRRHHRLPVLVLAECLENQGRFLPAIDAIVQAICDEKSWTLPAHDRSLKNFKGEELDIDLWSSAQGWELATTQSWLGDKLSAPVQQRIRVELDRRIFQPYRSYLATGRPGMFWITGTNNWNAVCTAGVIGTALATLASRDERAIYVAAAEKSNTYFLSGFTADGYCSEGLGYWNYGFGHFLLLAEAVRQATGGQLDWMKNDKVRTVAQFSTKLELLPGLYPAFADCSVNSRPDTLLMGYVSRRYGFGWSDWEQGAWGPQAGPLGSLFQQGLYRFNNTALPAQPAASATQPPALRDFFSEAGILICRAPQAGNAGLAVALKGGHNAEHHNHNDLGSFVVAAGHSTPLLDPGGEVYTARTFSSRRYDSQLLNSFGHPVPRVAGQLQREGRAHEAKVLATEFTPETDKFVLDLRAAYEVPTLKRLVRTFVFSRADHGRLTVTDEVEFDSPQAFGTALLTFGPWQPLDDGRLLFGAKPDQLQVSLQAEGGKLAVQAEEIHEDSSLRKTPLRIGLDFTAPVTKARIEVTVQQP
jgi:hypothetical protein